MKSLIAFFLLLVSFIAVSKTSSAPPIVYHSPGQYIAISQDLLLFEEKNEKLPLNNIQQQLSFFSSNDNPVPNFGVTTHAVWCYFSLENKTSDKLVLEMNLPITDSISLYKVVHDSAHLISTLGMSIPFSKRKYQSENFIFDLPTDSNQTNNYLLKLTSHNALQIPLSVGSYQTISEKNSHKDAFFGLYAGILFIMVVYNLLLYFSARDPIYLAYVMYTLFVCLVQIALGGYTQQYFWQEGWLTKHSISLLGTLSGFAFLMVIWSFLSLKDKHYGYKIPFCLVIASYSGALVFNLFGALHLSYQLVDVSALSVMTYAFITATIFSIKGDRLAQLFLLGWAFFLGGVVVFILSNIGIVPTSNYTIYIMPVTSAIEIIILSFALAYRVKRYKQERQKAIQEKDRLLLEQNKFLELKVKERTQELKLQTLIAQMNPHFIFNALNSVQHYILGDNKLKAQAYLSKVSKLIRFQLESSFSKTVPFEDELESVQAYLEIEKVRFNQSFDYQIKGVHEVLEQKVQIPSMLIIPFLENAIWHGIMKLDDPSGKIRIQFEWLEDALFCTIDDNGIGITASQQVTPEKSKKHRSIGIEVTKDRLQISHDLNQTEYVFSILDKNDEGKHGTRVRLSIPYVRKD